MSMITVQFFASLREQLGEERVDIAWEQNGSLSELINRLEDHFGKASAGILTASEVLIAINQTMIPKEQRADLQLKPSDEVAFLPPVTGG